MIFKVLITLGFIGLLTRALITANYGDVAGTLLMLSPCVVIYAFLREEIE